MHRIVTHISFYAILLVATSSALAQSASGPSPEDSANPSEQVFKNIQVLKGIPANQIVLTMQFISNSLGVQ
ncbi:MAG: hypothetical protein WA738_21075 [Candidatus Angelobacter sp.]